MALSMRFAQAFCHPTDLVTSCDAALGCNRVAFRGVDMPMRGAGQGVVLRAVGIRTVTAAYSLEHVENSDHNPVPLHQLRIVVVGALNDKPVPCA